MYCLVWSVVNYCQLELATCKAISKIHGVARFTLASIELGDNTLHPLWFSHYGSRAVYHITIADNPFSLSGCLCVCVCVCVCVCESERERERQRERETEKFTVGAQFTFNSVSTQSVSVVIIHLLDK